MIKKKFSTKGLIFFLYLIPEKMNANPWRVDSIQEFCFFKCPECPFTNKNEIFFRDHASRNHPLSVEFFDECNKRNSESNTIVKEEPEYR